MLFNIEKIQHSNSFFQICHVPCTIINLLTKIGEQMFFIDSNHNILQFTEIVHGGWVPPRTGTLNSFKQFVKFFNLSTGMHF